MELSISIHTSAREVTEDDGTHGSDHNNFNPHFRKGSDVWCGIPSAGSGISIHTSAREVTSGGECAEVFPDNFNPHFRKGSDRQDIPHEIRNQHFNPHFRKGSDPSSNFLTSVTQISIHTSAREVTAGQEVSHKALGISIHTSAREVTTHPVCWMWTGLDFNPHFRKGSDLPVYFIQTGI